MSPLFIISESSLCVVQCLAIRWQTAIGCMDLKTKICVWIIAAGLVNFLAFAVAWFVIDGDAIGGWVGQAPDGTRTYHLRPPMQPQDSRATEPGVSRATFIYSGVHCISIWITVAAVMLAMLTLAKDRIVSAIPSTVLHGRLFITVLAVVIAVAVGVVTFFFVHEFVYHLNHPILTGPG